MGSCSRQSRINDVGTFKTLSPTSILSDFKFMESTRPAKVRPSFSPTEANRSCAATGANIENKSPPNAARPIMNVSIDGPSWELDPRNLVVRMAAMTTASGDKIAQLLPLPSKKYWA